jgi:hypothetical protein
VKRLAALLAAIAVATAQAAPQSTSDAEVTSVVMEHFSSRTDSMSAHESGVTLILPDTAKWSAESIRYFSLNRGDDQCPITQELYDRLAERNSSSGPAAGLVGKSRKWRAVRPGEEKSEIPSPRASAPPAEPIKTVVGISRPAFAQGGDLAFVMFSFRWSIHSAIAQYLVKRSGNEWKVVCSQLRFYP